MYLPSHFEENRADVLHRFVGEQPFGLLITQGAAGIEANGVPFLLDADPAGGPGILRAHVARANDVWKSARTDVESLVVFQGPDTYVSPAWYPSKAEHGKVVPTWNYMMVQARGALRVIDDPAWVHAFVSRLTDHHEAGRTRNDSSAGAPPWAVSDAPPDYVDVMLRAIVGIEIVLHSLAGKWKTSQNRSAADRAGVARALAVRTDDKSTAMSREVRAPDAAS